MAGGRAAPEAGASGSGRGRPGVTLLRGPGAHTSSARGAGDTGVPAARRRSPSDRILRRDAPGSAAALPLLREARGKSRPSPRPEPPPAADSRAAGRWAEKVRETGARETAAPGDRSARRGDALPRRQPPRVRRPGPKFKGHRPRRGLSARGAPRPRGPRPVPGLRRLAPPHPPAAGPCRGCAGTAC